MGIGNRSPVAEFNILCDPEAARIVCECGVRDIIMVPLEVTHTALCTSAVRSSIQDALEDQQFGRCLLELMTFFEDTYKRVFKFDSPPVHDPCAVAYVLDPTRFETERMRVDVETGSDLCAGQTVCDVWHYSKLPKNV